MQNFGFKRKLPSEAVTGGNQILDISYNRYIGGQKTLPIAGQLTNLGDLAAVKGLPDKGAIVAIFNASAVPVYVKVGDSTVAAPVSGVDGIAVPAGRYLTIACGNNTHIISNATCYGYIVEDDTFLAPVSTY